MINVNQITAQLAKMPDQALQQYAMMHKNDPYTVSLALSESNRRKQMRDSAQGQQGMAPQPKVVDQDIAGMAAPAPQPMPEDVGIGALPAPNMQGMAGGGIVAFGDGGVPRVGSHGLAALIPDKTGYEGMGIMEFLQAFGTDMLNKLPTEEKVRLQQNQAKKEAAAAPNMQAYKPRPTMEQGQMDILYEKSGLMPSAPVVIPTPAGLALDGTPAPNVKPPPSPPGDGIVSLGGAKPRAPAAPELGYADRLKAALGENPDEDRFAKRREDITKAAKTGAEEGLAKLKADQEAEYAAMFKGKEERIGKREAELGKSKDTNTGMAFLEAGLAMMQSRGRGLAGIAEGAAVGTKQYAAGIKDIKAAQEKLDDARDRVEELRQNQSSMNKREVRAEESKIRDIVTQGQERQLAGAEKAYGIRREDMGKAVASDIAVRQAELDRQNRTAIAGMPGDQQKMLTALGGKGGLEAGLTKMQEIQADKTGAAYAKLFTETRAEAVKNGATPPTAVEFAASLRQLAAALNPGKVPGAVDVPEPGRK
jgi:hypothetical protein